MADELKARARTDELTALPNFRAFRERIDAELERADRYPERFGVLVLDLDRFKKYNDTYGHSRRQRRAAPRRAVDPRDRAHRRLSPRATAARSSR